MVSGWRKAFCTSIKKEKVRDSTSTPMQEKSNPTTPKLSGFGFFSSSSSTPSTPRLQSQPVSSSPGLRCRTSAISPPETPPAPTEPSPKLYCKTSSNSPRFFLRSNASSPSSPSTFSFLKSINALSLSKNTRCGICLHIVKKGQGTAIFTAECSHTFHFHCIADHLRKQGVTCPVCSAQWTVLPPPSIHNLGTSQEEERKRGLSSSLSSSGMDKQSSGNGRLRCVLKVYNDDEPLMSPKSGGLFNPIPESDEIDDDNEDVAAEFQGLFPERSNSPFHRSPIIAGNIEMEIMPDAAVVSVGRGGQTCVVVLKFKAPPAPIKTRRIAPIDLVAVIDVGGKISNEKLQLMKRLMRFLVSSLTAADRLSIVAFSSTSKRLLPLKRMTAAGRRTARRIVEAIIPLDGTASLSAKDALKKAAKVVEDRREKNPATCILLLSNSKSNDNRSDSRQSHIVHTTRLPSLEIPVHTITLNKTGEYDHAPPLEEHLGKCLESRLCLAAQDLRLQLGIVSGSAPCDISGVYSSSGGSVAVGSGLVRVGDMYAEEERELMVELTVPSMASSGAHILLSVRSSFIDPSTQKLVQGKEQALLVPRPLAVRSSNPKIERLRGLFITTRALAESRRLVERNELAGASHVLSTGRALLLQSRAGSRSEFLRSLEVEQSELQNRRQKSRVPQQVRRNQNWNVDEKANEPLTPTSAWRAAERLAKVAMTRKCQNRVSDLHGFENARF